MEPARPTNPRDTRDPESDERLAESIAALKLSLAQTAAGQAISFEEAAQRLTQKYDV